MGPCISTLFNQKRISLPRTDIVLYVSTNNPVNRNEPANCNEVVQIMESKQIWYRTINVSSPNITASEVKNIRDTIESLRKEDPVEFPDVHNHLPALFIGEKYIGDHNDIRFYEDAHVLDHILYEVHVL